MNKFVSAIAGAAEGIKLKRAQNTATSAKLAQEALINDKRQFVQGIEARLTSLLDIGPDSADSLRPVARDFNAQDWVNSVQEIKVSLKKANESLSIAEATYAEWFSEQPTAVVAR